MQETERNDSESINEQQSFWEDWLVGVKKTGKGRRKIGRKKRRMRARIRHRKK
ncbi:MAG: hypothetical protein U0892_18300 [Pirellulales bacterium]